MLLEHLKLANKKRVAGISQSINKPLLFLECTRYIYN